SCALRLGRRTLTSAGLSWSSIISEVGLQVCPDPVQYRRAARVRDESPACNRFMGRAIHPCRFLDEIRRDRRDFVPVGVATFDHPGTYEVLVETLRPRAAGER